MNLVISFFLDKQPHLGYCNLITLQEMMEDSRSEGIEQGIHALIDTCFELGLTREFTKNKTAEKFKISQDQAEHFMLRFWK